MNPPWKISRRHLLRGLGASLALPYLEAMGSSKSATGLSPAPPVRLACLFQPNGVYPKHWDVTGLGRDFALSPILQPLTPHQEDIIVLKNLDNIGSGHVGLTSSFLTAVGVHGRTNAVSLDQMVAQKIGGQTRLPSMVLGTEPPRQGGDGGQPIAFANTVSWSSETTRIAPEINPQLAFDRMFREQNSPEARRAAQNRLSVIDLVLEDAKSLRRRAGAADQAKLDEYLESVRAVEVQIERTLNPPEKTWEPPTQPELVRPAAGIPSERDKHLRLMMDLLVLAFQTDTTRVATLMTAHGFSRQNFSFLPGVNSDHHGMSHHKNKEELTAEYTTVSTWYIEQFAYLLQRMKQVDEGNGSLLDNTIVLYGSGMKDGNSHIPKDLPILLAGRGGGTLDPGRHIVEAPGTPMANLHLTLAQKMGLELESFNGASTSTIGALA